MVTLELLGVLPQVSGWSSFSGSTELIIQKGLASGQFIGLGLFAPWTEDGSVKITLTLEHEDLIVAHLRAQVSRDGKDWVRLNLLSDLVMPDVRPHPVPNTTIKTSIVPLYDLQVASQTSTLTLAGSRRAIFRTLFSESSMA